MKIPHVLLIAAIAATVFCGDSFAQERMFGGGKFLRRLRGDITGNTKKADPKTKTPKLADPKKTPTKKSTADTKSKGGPTPASDAIPTRADAFYGKEIGSGTGAASKKKTTPRTVLGGEKLEAIPTKSSRKSTIGFGMLIEEVKDQLVVTDINQQGNALREDIRKRDILVGVGGVEISNLQEYNEITDILREGDQIEMQFSRRGKELKKKIVQLGDTPKPPATAPERSPQLESKIEPLTSSRTSLNSTPQTQGRAVNNDVVRRQQQQIQEMQRELERLRKMRGQQSGSEGQSILEGPSLSGPGL